jgi:hypothetical protein
MNHEQKQQEILKKIKIIEKQFKEWHKAKRIGRQHVIHKNENLKDMEILCETKKWQCSDENWEAVECIYCLKKGLEIAKQKATEHKIEVEKNGCGEKFKSVYQGDVICERKYHNNHDIGDEVSFICPACQKVLDKYTEMGII